MDGSSAMRIPGEGTKGKRRRRNGKREQTGETKATPALYRRRPAEKAFCFGGGSFIGFESEGRRYRVVRSPLVFRFSSFRVCFIVGLAEGPTETGDVPATYWTGGAGGTNSILFFPFLIF